MIHIVNHFRLKIWYYFFFIKKSDTKDDNLCIVIFFYIFLLLHNRPNTYGIIMLQLLSRRYLLRPSTLCESLQLRGLRESITREQWHATTTTTTITTTGSCKLRHYPENRTYGFLWKSRSKREEEEKRGRENRRLP